MSHSDPLRESFDPQIDHPGVSRVEFLRQRQPSSVLKFRKACNLLQLLMSQLTSDVGAGRVYCDDCEA